MIKFLFLTFGFVCKYLYIFDLDGHNLGTVDDMSFVNICILNNLKISLSL